MKNMPITVEMVVESGFSHGAYWDVQQAEFLPEVRKLCADNLCGKYGSCWVCPPGCGELDEIADWIRGFDYGILVQLTGDMTDPMDYTAMVRTMERFANQLEVFQEKVANTAKNVRILKAGSCTKCKTCTYPDAPCRFPAQASPSLEACGLMVQAECTKSGLDYEYGPNTMTFIGAILVQK